jgi:hypothetical protein
MGRLNGKGGVLGLVNAGTGWSVTLNGIPGVYWLGEEYLGEHNYVALDSAIESFSSGRPEYRLHRGGIILFERKA